MNEYNSRNIISCRHLQEITESINIICKDTPIIIMQKNSDPKELNKMWNNYLQQLEKNNKCIKNKKVQQILNYEIDYNEILHTKNSEIRTRRCLLK
jgi:hypothetical protein